MSDIAGRKADHLDLTARADVAFRRSTLLEDVELIHDALPELDFDDIELGVTVLGKRLSAPLVIAAMTGGTDRAREINECLAGIAQEQGYGFGLGSQRPMLLDPKVSPSFAMRHVAPDALILGNIGGVQAKRLSVEEAQALVDAVDANALCVHLNPAMELIQAEGDRNFCGVADAIERLNRGLSVPLIVKETGNGLSAGVARRLAARGIRHVDVSGAGGTSWVAVETARATDSRRGLGETFREWGIPTAASVAYCASAGFETVIATGGIVTGLDVARAIALGATATAIARPVLIAYEQGGADEVRRYLKRVETELRTAMLLVSSRTLADLASAPRLIHSRLSTWLGSTS